jgi:hypothetical protein
VASWNPVGVPLVGVAVPLVRVEVPLVGVVVLLVGVVQRASVALLVVGVTLARLAMTRMRLRGCSLVGKDPLLVLPDRRAGPHRVRVRPRRRTPCASGR